MGQVVRGVKDLYPRSTIMRKEKTIGTPHEDLPVLEELNRRLGEDLERAKTLGGAGEGGSIYQAISSVKTLVEEEAKTVRRTVGG